MSKTLPTPSAGIIETPFSEALSQRYLAYAMSTIVSRSLPDVRDGLKPVHRRLLFAMRQLKLNPEGGFKKCARVVGDVIGKYHPHGDTAVYDTLVRLAQDFAVRYPLVEGQGNFGNIDGDNAAAMRYTESKLTQVASALMDGLDENAVDFSPTYDGTEDEPVVMPAAFPNLLANGSAGIAVGMATSIPPHNVGEICKGLQHLIKHPDCSVADLVMRMPGPDFPTGGILVESSESILQSYTTGRGSFRLRARWSAEKLTHGRYQIVIDEIPYQVQKSRVIEKIAELLNLKKLPFLADIRDESAEDVRIVLEPRNRSVEPEMLMEQLFRQTDLEIRFSLNMNVLNRNSVPSVMDLKQVMVAFLAHRMEVLERKSQHRLDKIIHRLEVLEGYLIAYLNLDEVIRIIREEDHAKPSLMKSFSLTEIQAEAILNMRLRSLRKLEELEIKKEHDSLSAEKVGLEDILSNESLRWSLLAKEVTDMDRKFGKKTNLGKRRTELSDAIIAVVVPIEAVIEREPITVILSQRGWLRAIKGHQDDLSGLKFKEGDSLHLSLKAETTDKLIFFASDGKVYTLGGDKLPSGRGFGEPLRLMVDLDNDAEIVTLLLHVPNRSLLVAADDGRGFIVEESNLLAQTRSGKTVLILAESSRAAFCVPVIGDAVAILGKNRKLLIFMTNEIPVMTRGRGVILQKYKDAHVADIKMFTLAKGLSWKSGERTRCEMDLTLWLGKRASVGRIPPTGFPRSNRFT